MAKPTGNPTGRPKAVIDFELVKKLGMIQCTVREIAAVLDIPHSTLDGRADFRAVYEIAREHGKASLRRIQYRLAEKSAGMAIFLGKNYLGQRDDQYVRGEGFASKTIIYNITHPNKLLSKSEQEAVARPDADAALATDGRRPPNPDQLRA